MSCKDTFMDMVIKVENTFIQPIQSFALAYTLHLLTLQVWVWNIVGLVMGSSFTGYHLNVLFLHIT